MEEEKQTTIEEVELPRAQGFIRNLSIRPIDGGDPVYKFQLRYLDKDDNIVEPEEWYSGFKNAPGVDGDYINFAYKINGIYNNVKDVFDIKLTHESTDMEDTTRLEEVKSNIVKPKLETDMNGDNATITQVEEELASDGLSEPYRALLLNATIQLCTRRGTMSDEEIVAQYNRFLKII